MQCSQNLGGKNNGTLLQEMLNEGQKKGTCQEEGSKEKD